MHLEEPQGAASFLSESSDEDLDMEPHHLAVAGEEGERQGSVVMAENDAPNGTRGASP